MQEKSRENSFNDVIDTKPNRVSPVHGKIFHSSKKIKILLSVEQVMLISFSYL